MTISSISELSEIIQNILGFMKNEMFDSSIDLKPDTNLFESGFDSFSLMKLLVFIEKKYNIHVPEEAITESNMQNITNFSKLIYALKKK